MGRRSILTVLALGVVMAVISTVTATAHPAGRSLEAEAYGLVALQNDNRESRYEPVVCEDGMAGDFACSNVDLMSHIGMAELGSVFINDIWGWYDSVTRRDYAILAGSEGAWVIDVSAPLKPWVVGHLPTWTTAGGDFWRDIKVYADHAFIGSENTGHGIQILDLTQVRNIAQADAPVTFTTTARYTGVTGNAVGNSHNLNINEDTGFLYVVGSGSCSGGLHMVNISNPTSPTFAGCWSAGGYVHDTQCVVYAGPDAAYRGRELCFNSSAPNTNPNSNHRLTIVDVTDKATPVLLGSRNYPNQGYSHQGWLTPKHDFFLHGDELDEMTHGNNTKTRVFDVRNIADPQLTAEYVNPSATSIDHNLYTKGRFSYHSNYTSGLRVYSNADVANGVLEEVAFFDMYPQNDAPTFEGGTWSNYPYLRRDNLVAVSSIDRGFFLLRVRLAGGRD